MIMNVTPTTFDHLCEVCGDAKQDIPHSALLIIPKESGKPTLHYVSCEKHGPKCQRVSGGYCGVDTGCMRHVESFNGDLPEHEEFSATRDEASREHVRQVRALHQHVVRQP